jgi:hypothetical protein
VATMASDPVRKSALYPVTKLYCTPLETPLQNRTLLTPLENNTLLAPDRRQDRFSNGVNSEDNKVGFCNGETCTVHNSEVDNPVRNFYPVTK